MSICPKCSGTGIGAWDKSQPLSTDVQRAIDSGARPQCGNCGGTGKVMIVIGAIDEPSDPIVPVQSPKAPGADSGKV